MSVWLGILLGLLPVFELFEAQFRQFMGDATYVETYQVLGILLMVTFCLIFAGLGGYKLIELCRKLRHDK